MFRGNLKDTLQGSLGPCSGETKSPADHESAAEQIGSAFRIK